MEAGGSQRVCVITGANTGIGKVTALGVAMTGARVMLACRSESRTLPVVAEIIERTGNESIEFITLDLSDLASVNDCADRLLASGAPIHLLINNAGLLGAQGITRDGFELHFGVNHLGHFLLTMRLLDRIVASDRARIVNVASRAHRRVKRMDFDRIQERTSSISGFSEYAVSKLANVMFTRSLASRLSGTGVHTYALHPGVVRSDIWRQRIPRPLARVMGLFMLSTEDGAQTTLHCSLSDEAATETGLYYDRLKPQDPSKLAQDESLAEELWGCSTRWTCTD